ncbi:hypothetical protein L579_3327 [Pantoea sp. AS-PWVM4]|nr:hypothetical protein L579_3327 [Pantoea sp. AS-PWVM4]
MFNMSSFVLLLKHCQTPATRAAQNKAQRFFTPQTPNY